jgi:hypothetical protein
MGKCRAVRRTLYCTSHDVARWKGTHHLTASSNEAENHRRDRDGNRHVVSGFIVMRHRISVLVSQYPREYQRHGMSAAIWFHES